jgi:hypothetical protein
MIARLETLAEAASKYHVKLMVDAEQVRKRKEEMITCRCGLGWVRVWIDRVTFSTTLNIMSGP